MLVNFFDIVDRSKNIGIEEKRYKILIPKEFEHIKGNYTVFELVALWNKDTLSENSLGFKPMLSHFRGIDEIEIQEYYQKGKTKEEIEEIDKAFRQTHYEKALAKYRENLDKIKDFKVLSDIEMQEKYGVDYLHELGVAIYRSEDLKYPLKLTFDTNTDLKYEDIMQRSR